MFPGGSDFGGRHAYHLARRRPGARARRRPDAQPAPPIPAVEVAKAPSEAELATRRSRLATWIRAGWHEGWLERDEMRAAFGKLRANRNEEGEMRAAGQGPLTDAQRLRLAGGLDDLSTSLRHTRAQKGGGHRRTH